MCRYRCVSRFVLLYRCIALYHCIAVMRLCHHVRENMQLYRSAIHLSDVSAPAMSMPMRRRRPTRGRRYRRALTTRSPSMSGAGRACTAWPANALGCAPAAYMNLHARPRGNGWRSACGNTYIPGYSWGTHGTGCGLSLWQRQGERHDARGRQEQPNLRAGETTKTAR